MAKSGLNKFMDFLRLSDPEEEDFEDDLFDDEEEDFYEMPKKKMKDISSAKYYEEDEDDDFIEEERIIKHQKAKSSKPTSSNKLVSINSRNNRSNNQVYVIKPQEFNEAQKVTDFLKEGKTIVINMEGIEVHAAQRIIDFIGGACYALDGSLQAISSNIFIAAPRNIDVSGDLRDEILNDSTLAPELSVF